MSIDDNKILVYHLTSIPNILDPNLRTERQHSERSYKFICKSQCVVGIPVWTVRPMSGPLSSDRSVVLRKEKLRSVRVSSSISTGPRQVHCCFHVPLFWVWWTVHTENKGTIKSTAYEVFLAIENMIRNVPPRVLLYESMFSVVPVLSGFDRRILHKVKYVSGGSDPRTTHRLPVRNSSPLVCVFSLTWVPVKEYVFFFQ